MSTYIRRRLCPQGQPSIAGQRRGNVIPSRRRDGADCPFPNKPVSHRRPLNPRTQGSFDLYDFEKRQPLDTFLHQEHQVNGIRESIRSQQPRKESFRLSSGEMQMARAIQVKELMLQEKLYKVEEKIRRLRSSEDSDDVVTNDVKSGEERLKRGKAESEQQRREAVRNKDMLMQDRRQEDVKQTRRKQDQKNEDRMKNTHEEEGARWKQEVSNMPPISQQKTAPNVTSRNHKGVETKISGVSALPPVHSPARSTRPEEEEQLVPCRICNRKFTSKRIEKHIQICEKVNQSHRLVFNSYVNRTKGSALEEFLKTHSRSKTPEVLQKKNQRQNYKTNTKNVQQSRPLAGATQPQRSK